ncbi:hypothetical protein E2C01_062285 [Portunus trituberculatus]|uniref:Uncharacterized protein n=1 Tax=Portunus trituberculatus TaxID=210409 RepID=A0A5B7HD79_PORTR|nr:hypothetical protein [Portunus trituberculatus]
MERLESSGGGTEKCSKFRSSVLYVKVKWLHEMVIKITSGGKVEVAFLDALNWFQKDLNVPNGLNPSVPTRSLIHPGDCYGGFAHLHNLMSGIGIVKSVAINFLPSIHPS